MPTSVAKAAQPQAQAPAPAGRAAAPHRSRAAPSLADKRPATAASRQQQARINASPHVRRAAETQALIAQSPRQQAAQLQAAASVKHQETPASMRGNNTGLPDKLKVGVENLSGYSLDNVRVHYNSDKPAQLQAHAFAQGTDIHVAPGQEKHLPHEAWHVVQQKEGRVKPTMQMKGLMNVNDDAGLEKEADAMGARALLMNSNIAAQRITKLSPVHNSLIQCVIDFSKKSKQVPVENIEQMVVYFVKKYGESHREYITDKINKIQNNHISWSPYDVYRSFLEDKLPVFSEVEFGEHSSKPTLPGSSLEDKERYAAVNQFGFNSVTRLVGDVGTLRFETRNSTDDDLHAEEVFIDLVTRSGVQLKKKTVINITINNSPCAAKCSVFLANWVKKNKLQKVTIHFANPFGSDEEFSAAMTTLQNVGIRIHGFLPLDNIGSDTDEEIEPEYRTRFDKMATKLKSAKANKLYASDGESDSDEFDTKLSDRLLKQARTFWDEEINTIVEQTNYQFLGRDDYEKIYFDDTQENLEDVVENPYNIDYIENHKEFEAYIHEIKSAVDGYINDMIHKYS